MTVPPRLRTWRYFEVRDPSDGRLRYATIDLSDAERFVEGVYYKSKRKGGTAVLCSIKEQVGRQEV